MRTLKVVVIERADLEQPREPGLRTAFAAAEGTSADVVVVEQSDGTLRVEKNRAGAFLGTIDLRWPPDGRG